MELHVSSDEPSEADTTPKGFAGLGRKVKMKKMKEEIERRCSVLILVRWTDRTGKMPGLRTTGNPTE